MSNKTKKFGDPRKRTVNNQKIPNQKELSEIYQRNIFRLLVECEPRNIPFYIFTSNICKEWIYPDLGMSFDTKIMKSILSEKGLI